ncbi:spore coat protein [Pseudalkalibacillus hwajinpoensis]|uniref:Spore coat protein n=1 Tax=Guptibacillus hwajinpoensis TaxID=208199 RepID=A0A4U1MNP8_9BACL|nr:spore coat protein [Pseudalkalibacillus hwajinpoensis]TKD72464.1 spore coat protein [Pseudalkalibacillus hwajinpoensis]
MGSNLKYLDDCIGRIVQVDRGGPESQSGILLANRDDFFILKGENEATFYYQHAHVKSISLNTQDGFALTNVLLEEELSESITFTDVLNELRHKWVNINRGGPSKMEGVIDNVQGDVLTLIHQNTLLTVPIFHIRNVTLGAPKIEENEEPGGKNNDKF